MDVDWLRTLHLDDKTTFRKTWEIDLLRQVFIHIQGHLVFVNRCESLASIMILLSENVTISGM